MKTNRVTQLPNIHISGFEKDNKNSFLNVLCKLGEFPENPTNAEDDEDLNIYFYFASVDDIKKGTEDFVVTSYTYNGVEINLTESEINSQL